MSLPKTPLNFMTAMNKITCGLVLIFCSFVHAIAQEYDGFPEDLNTSGLVFLKYKQLIPNIDATWKKKKQLKIRNKWASEANEELLAYTKKYPFKNTTVFRTIPRDSLLHSGYKYRLNCDIMDTNNQGIGSPDPYKAQIAPLYIENLDTKALYYLFDVKQSPNARSYGYADILKTFEKYLKDRF